MTNDMKQSIIEEASILMTGHPSKDARWFAKSVYEFFMAEQPAEQEPVAEVAWDLLNPNATFLRFLPPGVNLKAGTKLYTAQQPAEQEPIATLTLRDDMGADIWFTKSFTLLPGQTLKLYTAPQPAIPPGYKLVPEVPTNEWINNLARRQTGSLEAVPFAEIHQCIAELLEAAPEAPQPAKREPLTGGQIRKWWASENGLEDCDMAKLDDFEKVVRAIEAAHGITKE